MIVSQLYLESLVRCSNYFPAHEIPSNTNMAPSRAVARCVAQLRLQSTARLQLAHRIQYRPISVATASHPLPLLSRSVPRPLPSSKRPYSSSSTSSPEPPDYLSEGELHVFNKIKAELHPVRLEVCHLPVSLHSPITPNPQNE